MYDLQAFRKKVQELCHRSMPYDDGRHATQRDLAEAIGLHPTELSKRLNGARDARLTDRDVRSMVLTFAEWGAIQSQAEATELLTLVSGASFSPAEWQSPPLDSLIPLEQRIADGTGRTVRMAPPRSNLPQALTSFIGRRREIAEVEQLMGQTRLLTITGAGGCGKTRLALELASRRTSFADDVWLVELAALRDPQLVVQALAASLGLREQPGTPLLDTLTSALQGREMLLILDNCEHLLQAAASLANHLLLHCPTLQILSTSREPLRTEGEVVWRLPSLSLPEAQAKTTLRSLGQYEAIRLFLERARAALPQMAMTQGNAEAVREICVRLDGIPLAIELAAVMVRMMSLEQIRTHLDDRFTLLTSGNRTSLPRQQTLKALIDWSYDLLTADEQRLLARLAVFAGGFTLEAVEAICADQRIKAGAVVIGLGRLVDKSLVIKEEQDDSARYRLLETIRQYAADKLTTHSDEEEVRDRHTIYYLALAEQAEPELRGAQQVMWLNRLEQEHDNLRAALGWSFDKDESEMGMRLSGALWKFWETHGHISEGRRWLEMALAKRNEASPLALAKVLNGAGILAWNQSDHLAARSLLEDGLRIYRELGDKRMIARLLGNIGVVVEDNGDYLAAHDLLEESLGIYRELGDNVGIAPALNNFGNLLMYLGRYDEARAIFEETVAFFRELGESRGIAIALHNLAMPITARGDFELARTLREESLVIFRQLGDERNTAYVLESLGDISAQEGKYAEAYSLFEESLTILQRLGDEWAVAILLNNLGNVSVNQGNYVQARDYYQTGIKVQHKMGNKKGISESLEGFATLAVCEGQMQRAAQLLGICEALRATTGTPLTPAEHAVYERNIAAAHAELGEVMFTTAWMKGQAMSLEEAVNYALIGE